MTSRRPRLVPALLCATLLSATPWALAPGRAAASPAENEAAEADGLRRAQRHFKRGEKLYALGRFEDALAAYQAAFEASPLPEFLFNVGQCHRNLKRYDEAIFAFKKYLRLEPDAPNRDAVEGLIADLDRQRDDARARAAPDLTSDGAAPDGSRPDLVSRSDGTFVTSSASRTGRSRRTPRETPFYRRTWFYVALGAVAVGTGAAVLLLPSGGVPDTDVGNLNGP